MSCYKLHIHCAPLTSEPALGLQQRIISDTLQQAHQHNVSENLTSCGQKGDASAVTFLLIDADNTSIHPLLRSTTCIPDRSKHLTQAVQHQLATIFEYFSRPKNKNI